ncbi:MAG TPA: NADH-quinone oxidoreductase subunit J [Gemmatimonadales bacterium]|nr:NADH-quinone oxidoreductase subunit J [Gemmatimonadales bacterium]
MVQAVYWFFAGVAVVGALACVLDRNPVHSALGLISCMLSLAGLYVLLDAPFVGAVQVLVYAGAIMVLFLFVIMLLNLGRVSADARGPLGWAVGATLAGGLLALLAGLGAVNPSRIARDLAPDPMFADPALILPRGREALAAAEAQGIIGAAAGPLFDTWLVPFEVTSLLLLAAMVGAVVLAKRRI